MPRRADQGQSTVRPRANTAHANDYKNGSSGMTYALIEAKEQIRTNLETLGPELRDLVLEHPPKGIDADLAMPVFPLAKAWRKGPPVIAKEIVERLAWPEDGLIAGAEAA